MHVEVRLKWPHRLFPSGDYSPLLNPEHKYAHPYSMLEKLKPILISNFFERVFSGFTPALMSEKPFSFIQSIVAVIASIAYPGEHKRD